MKKLLLIAVAGLLMTSVAMAQAPVPPVGIYEVEVYPLLPDGQYDPSVPPTIKDPTANARCFASNEAEGNCNKYEWVIPITVHASVAQWIDFTMTGTRWDWFVKKPGWYAANCITAKVASNGDILIDYEGFDNLQGLNNEIPIWYAFGGSMATAAAGWVPAPLLNDDDDWLYEADYWSDGRNFLHEGLTWKLWNRIHVIDCNTACEYEDVAAIILTLESQKPWIEQNPEAPNYGTYIDYGPYFDPMVP